MRVTKGECMGRWNGCQTEVNERRDERIEVRMTSRGMCAECVRQSRRLSGCTKLQWALIRTISRRRTCSLSAMSIRALNAVMAEVIASGHYAAVSRLPLLRRTDLAEQLTLVHVFV